MIRTFVIYLDQVTKAILAEDLTDIRTPDSIIPNLMTSILSTCNENFKKELMEKIKMYPLVKEVVLKHMDEHIADYEAELKKYRDLKSLF